MKISVLATAAYLLDFNNVDAIKLKPSDNGKAANQGPARAPDDPCFGASPPDWCTTVPEPRQEEYDGPCLGSNPPDWCTTDTTSGEENNVNDDAKSANQGPARAPDDPCLGASPPDWCNAVPEPRQEEYDGPCLGASPPDWCTTQEQ